MKRKMNENVMHIELRPGHKEELINKTKKLISIWEDHISKLCTEGPEFAKEISITEPGNVIRNVKEFNELVDSLYKKCKNEHVSRSTIESESICYIDNIIKCNFTANEDITKELDLLIKRLEGKVNLWEVVFPIDHLVLSNLKNVEMGSARLSQFSEISEEVNNGIKRSDLIDSKRTFLTEHIKKIRGKVCVSIEVIAEDENKYKEAWIEFENIINLLRIYSSCQIGDYGLKIGLSEDFLTQIILLSFRKDESGIWGGELRNTRFRMDYELTPERLQDLERNYYFSEIKFILGKSSRSEIDKQILLAMRWIGSGIHEEIDYDKIIKFTTALECLLIKGKNKDDKSKKESLAERCSFLLEEKDPAKRYKIYIEIKGHKRLSCLYDIRSNIVHGGEVVIDPKHVSRLRELAVCCLFKVISLSSDQNMREIQDIIDWVDKLKMRCYYGME